MKPITLVLLVFLVFCGANTRAQTQSERFEVPMPVMEFMTHVHGGPLPGRHYAPLAFVVSPEGSIRALVAGTVRRQELGGNVVPPSGDALIGVLQQGKTIGFTEREVKRYGPGFLKAFESARSKVVPELGASEVVVLIQNPKFVDASGRDLGNQLDQDWHQALSKQFKNVSPQARLLVIRLVFPNQRPDGTLLMSEWSCYGEGCGPDAKPKRPGSGEHQDPRPTPAHH